MTGENHLNWTGGEMNYGLSIPQPDDFADVRRLADLASEAE